MSAYKVVIVGGVGVGKSTLAIQFAHGQFVECDDPTIDESCYRKVIAVDNHIATLDISTIKAEWMTYQHESQLRAGQGYVLVYSVTSRHSFDELTVLKEEISRCNDEDTFPLVLVGNKSDLEDQRVVSTEDGATLANKWNIPFFESSARLRVNVDEMFCEVVRQIHNQQNTQVPAKKNGGAFLRKCAIL